MIKEAIGFGNTIDEAKENAIAKLNASEDDDIQFEVVATPKKKIMGLFGGSKAEVRVFVEVPDEKPKFVKKTAPVTQNKPAKSEVKVKKEINKEANVSVDTAVNSKQDTACENKPSSIVDGFGEAVDSSLIPQDSQAGKAVAYLNEILPKLGCDNVKIKVAQKENAALIELDGEGLGVVIGHRAETLDALQYLTGLVANNGGGYFKVTLNIGNYREKREETLTNLAKRISAQVLKTGRSRSLEPMNPYERRIIHTAVQDIAGVVSTSFGDGANRRVVIAVEGGDTRPSRHENFGKRDRYSNHNRPKTTVAAPSREPKKDIDIPLYGKIK